MSIEHAYGTFEVTITPQPPGDSGIGRLELATRWHGGLDGSLSLTIAVDGTHRYDLDYTLT
jgi:hypothetical protein